MQETTSELAAPRSLALQAIAIIGSRYGIPKQMWDLCHSLSDLKEKRALYIEEGIPDALLVRLFSIQRFDIISIGMNDSFNRLLPPLPSTCKTIRTGRSFDQAFSLPFGIEAVELGEGFEKWIDLPPTVRELTVQRMCAEPLHLPAGLIEANLFCRNGIPYQIELPSSLQRLLISGAYTHPIHLPESLLEATLLFFEGPYEHTVRFPSSIKRLEFVGFSNTAPLPPYLEALRWRLASDIGTLSNTLQELDVYEPDFNYPLRLPSTLRVLNLSHSSVDHPLELPETLEELHLPKAFSHPVRIPEALKIAKLYMSKEYPHSLHLPYGLRELHIENNIAGVELPPTLVRCTFGYGFNQHLNLPRTVRNVFLRKVKYSHPVLLPPRCTLYCFKTLVEARETWAVVLRSFGSVEVFDVGNLI